MVPLGVFAEEAPQWEEPLRLRLRPSPHLWPTSRRVDSRSKGPQPSVLGPQHLYRAVVSVPGRRPNQASSRTQPKLRLVDVTSATRKQPARLNASRQPYRIFLFLLGSGEQQLLQQLISVQRLNEMSVVFM